MLFRIIQRVFNIYRGFQDSVKRATYSARIGFTTLYQGKNRPVVFKKTFDRMPTATVTIEASYYLCYQDYNTQQKRGLLLHSWPQLLLTIKDPHVPPLLLKLLFFRFLDGYEATHVYAEVEKGSDQWRSQTLARSK